MYLEHNQDQLKSGFSLNNELQIYMTTKSLVFIELSKLLIELQ